MSINAPDFDDLSCLFGPLAPESRERLQALLDNPCEDTWDDAYSIIVNQDEWLTLWQAVERVDDDFHEAVPPITRWVDDPTYEFGGYSQRISGWTRIPSQDAILQALRYAAS